MKLINNTDWETKDLKKIFKQCLKQEGMDDRNILFVCKKRRNNARVWGQANKWRNRIIVFLKSESQDKKEILNILKHELAHLRGVDHGCMNGGHFITDFGNNDWVENYGLAPKEKKVKLKRDLKQERHQKALKKVKEYQTKLKKTETILNKWKQKVKYYERGR